jgi:hypothetical protein
MKKRLSVLILSFLMVAISCKKEENKIYLESGTPPVLTASVTGPLVLVPANSANSAIRFNWTNPNYRLTTGISSHDVTYTLQVDTTGAGFKNPRIQEVSIAKDLSKDFTVKELNAVFGISKMNLLPGIPHNIEFRLKASLVGGAGALYSNVIKMVITPYLDVAVPLPTTGQLFLVGDATPGGWTNPVPLPTQQFTRVSTTLYEITLPLLGGGKHYLFLPLNGDWGNKYAVQNASQPAGGGDFGYNGGNAAFNTDMPGPLVDGTYKITVDFITGKYTVVKL